ncbi:FAD-dependent monooxygenase [Alphaproteobacteria bacterium]|nr:FAD-dependent monooxygenase [Alphaproteobacteria bacterium]
MKSAEITKHSSEEFFHKICVVGGGLTGAIMTLLLKESNLFRSHEIGWIKPKILASNDIRTTFYNKKSLQLLERLGLLKNLKSKDYTNINKIQVFGMNNSSPLEWDYSDSELTFGAVIRNDVVLKSVTDQLNDIKQYESLVTNTQHDEFERTLYLKDKVLLKTHMVLSADGKNSNLRKLLSIKTISKKVNHTALSGFLKQSTNHNFTAKQAFTNLGPIGLLPFQNKNIINFVLSVEDNKYKEILLKTKPEEYICNHLNSFFSHIDLKFQPLKKVNQFNNKLSSWKLDLNFIANPTAYRTILIGDAAHSIHPLAGQGLNLALRDCTSVIKSLKNNLKFGQDLGDYSILSFYKKDRLPKTIAMTAVTDFLFYGFTLKSNKTQSFLTKGMETLNKSNLKNIFRDIASI